MATIQLDSILSLKLMHSLQRGRTFSYRRRIPKDLQAAYGGKTHLTIALGTSDAKTATRELQRVVKELENRWALMRQQQGAVVINEREEDLAAGFQLLRDHGIDPDRPKSAPEGAQWVFHDTVEALLPEPLRNDPEVSGPDLDKHLPPAYRVALQAYQNRLPYLASDCQREYMAARCKTAQARKVCGFAFDVLLGLHEDRDIRQYSREDVRALVDHLLKDRKVSTATVERRTNTLRAAWAWSIKETSRLHGLHNVWSGVEIVGKGDDSTEREAFKIADYRKLFEAIDRRGTDDLRCLLTLLACTGARLAEITGAAVSDVDLQSVPPTITIKPHPWRRLKTDASTRVVPLVTERAVGAAKALVDLAGDSPYLVSRYTSDKGCKATSASAALNKWLSSVGLRGGLTCHSLRHGMRDLLRAVQCSDSIANEIQGWERPGIGNRYGSGTPMPILGEWLLKALTLLDKDGRIMGDSY